ncbi:hypothetical protein E8E15_000085, partial [Penicillium rubens]
MIRGRGSRVAQSSLWERGKRAMMSQRKIPRLPAGTEELYAAFCSVGLGRQSADAGSLAVHEALIFRP